MLSSKNIDAVARVKLRAQIKAESVLRRNMVLKITFAVLPLFFSLCICTVYDRASGLKEANFDFVVVGGGTAGAVLANRLSANEHFQVLVIEAGSDGQNDVNASCPYLWRTLSSSQFDWNFTSTPQKALNGRTIGYSAGHVLGGSSFINAMDYTRGSSDDYDRWARVTGDSGWSWNELLPYFKKNERFVPQVLPARSGKGQFDPSVHGFEGKTYVSLFGHSQSIDSRVIAAANELGGDFKFNIDMNTGIPLGTVWSQAAIGYGERSSSASSYLSPDVLKRSNLHVLVNTRVSRLVPSYGNEFRKVEFTDNTGAKHTVRAMKEVLLSAGAINSPRILLHSGIGGADELKSVGIKTLVDLPSVGKNLTDQPSIYISFLANTTFDTLRDNIARNATLFAEAFNQWKTERKGPMAVDGTNNFLWLRLLLKGNPDPSAGPNAPHLELFVDNGGSNDEPRVSVGAVIVSPASRGSVKITSSDPFGQVLIDPALLSAPVDAFMAREGVRLARKYFAAHAWDGYVISEAAPTANSTTDDELDAVLRENVGTVTHLAGSVAMSAKDAPYGVVDPDLRVKQVQGVRVVDASIMPFITAGHTVAPVYAIAERAADLILKYWGI